MHHRKKKMTHKKRIIAIGLSVATALGMASAAFAYFAVSSGTGNVTTSGLTQWTITLTAPSGGSLSPGVGTQNLGYTIQNSSSKSETLTTLTAAMTANAAGDVYDTASSTYVSGCLA